MTYTPPAETFIERLEQALREYAERPCVKFGEDTYTYREVDLLTQQIASDLAANGFEKGDKGAIYSRNSARVLIFTLGILRAGGIWIPVNSKNPESENVRVLNDLDCKALFYQSDFSAAADQLQHKLKNGLISRNINQQIFSLDPDPNTRDIDLKFAQDDLISLPQTGGTTGLPKGVMLSNANFNAMAFGLSRWFEDYDGPPKFLCVAPMTHVGGRIAVTAMISGAYQLVHESFEPLEVLRAIQREKITDVFLPPTAIYALLEEPELKRFDFSSLRNFLYGSAPISLEKLKKALKVFGPIMRNAYGQTECPTFITEMTPDDHFVDGKLAPDEQLQSVGHATALSEIAIVDKQGNPVLAGDSGEVAVKGAMVCLGYYQSKAETAKIQMKGWHLTGDIGYLNDEGFLYLVDRKKDMIVTGGFNVYSLEVEQTINRIPGVRFSQVIGIPSERWGEEVKALVQLDAGSDLDEEKILAICREHLGKVKTPKSVDFRDSFPLTAIGKVDKKSIREEFWTHKSTRI